MASLPPPLPPAVPPPQRGPPLPGISSNAKPALPSPGPPKPPSPSSTPQPIHRLSIAAVKPPVPPPVRVDAAKVPEPPGAPTSPKPVKTVVKPVLAPDVTPSVEIPANQPSAAPPVPTTIPKPSGPKPSGPAIQSAEPSPSAVLPQPVVSDGALPETSRGQGVPPPAPPRPNVPKPSGPKPSPPAGNKPPSQAMSLKALAAAAREAELAESNATLPASISVLESADGETVSEVKAVPQQSDAPQATSRLVPKPPAPRKMGGLSPAGSEVVKPPPPRKEPVAPPSDGIQPSTPTKETPIDSNVAPPRPPMPSTEAAPPPSTTSRDNAPPLPPRAAVSSTASSGKPPPPPKTQTTGVGPLAVPEVESLAPPVPPLPLHKVNPTASHPKADHQDTAAVEVAHESAAVPEVSQQPSLEAATPAADVQAPAPPIPPVAAVKSPPVPKIPPKAIASPQAPSATTVRPPIPSVPKPSPKPPADDQAEIPKPTVPKPSPRPPADDQAEIPKPTVPKPSPRPPADDQAEIPKPTIPKPSPRPPADNQAEIAKPTIPKPSPRPPADAEVTPAAPKPGPRPPSDVQAAIPKPTVPKPSPRPPADAEVPPPIPKAGPKPPADDHSDTSKPSIPKPSPRPPADAEVTPPIPKAGPKPPADGSSTGKPTSKPRKSTEGASGKTGAGSKSADRPKSESVTTTGTQAAGKTSSALAALRQRNAALSGADSSTNTGDKTATTPAAPVVEGASVMESVDRTASSAAKSSTDGIAQSNSNSTVVKTVSQPTEASTTTTDNAPSGASSNVQPPAAVAQTIQTPASPRKDQTAVADVAKQPTNVNTPPRTPGTVRTISGRFESPAKLAAAQVQEVSAEEGGDDAGSTTPQRLVQVPSMRSTSFSAQEVRQEGGKAPPAVHAAESSSLPAKVTPVGPSSGGESVTTETSKDTASTSANEAQSTPNVAASQPTNGTGGQQAKEELNTAAVATIPLESGAIVTDVRQSPPLAVQQAKEPAPAPVAATTSNTPQSLSENDLIVAIAPVSVETVPVEVAAVGPPASNSSTAPPQPPKTPPLPVSDASITTAVSALTISQLKAPDVAAVSVPETIPPPPTRNAAATQGSGETVAQLSSPEQQHTESSSVQPPKPTFVDSGRREAELAAMIEAAKLALAQERVDADKRIVALQNRQQASAKRAKIAELEAARGLFAAACGQAKRFGIPVSAATDAADAIKADVHDPTAVAALVEVLQKLTTDLLVAVELQQIDRRVDFPGIFQASSSGNNNGAALSMSQLETLAVQVQDMKAKCAAAAQRLAQMSAALDTAILTENMYNQQSTDSLREFERLRRVRDGVDKSATVAKNALATEIHALASQAGKVHVVTKMVAENNLNARISRLTEELSTYEEAERYQTDEELARWLRDQRTAHSNRANAWLDAFIAKSCKDMRTELVASAFQLAVARQTIIDLQRDIAALMYLIQESRRRNIISWNASKARAATVAQHGAPIVGFNAESTTTEPPDSPGKRAAASSRWITSLKKPLPRVVTPLSDATRRNVGSPLTQMTLFDDDRWFEQLQHAWDKCQYGTTKRVDWMINLDKNLSFSRHRADMWRSIAVIFGVYDRLHALLSVRKVRPSDSPLKQRDGQIAHAPESVLPLPNNFLDVTPPSLQEVLEAFAEVAQLQPLPSKPVVEKPVVTETISPANKRVAHREPTSETVLRSPPSAAERSAKSVKVHAVLRTPPARNSPAFDSALARPTLSWMYQHIKKDEGAQTPSPRARPTHPKAVEAVALHLGSPVIKQHGAGSPGRRDMQEDTARLTAKVAKMAAAVTAEIEKRPINDAELLILQRIEQAVQRSQI